MNNVCRATLSAGVAAVLAVASGVSFAQAAAPTTARAANAPPAPMGAAVSAQDRKFIVGAAEAGAAEVAMARLAKERAGSADVKDFAARMVSDHEKAGDELKSIAGARGVNPADQPSKKDQATIEGLGKLQGAEFDKAYIKAQLSAHKDAVALFRSEASAGKDAELKQFASATLPTLNDHLQMVQQLSRTSLQGSAQGKSATGTRS